MAVLKKIKFGSITTPIAMTQVAINENSNKALSVVATNTDLDVNEDPVYTIALAVDGKTITKTGEDGLATALKLTYHAAVTTEGSEKGAYIALEDNNGASIANSEIPVSDLIGNGILKNASYSETTGKLTLTFATASGSDKTFDIDLGSLLDIDDIVLKDQTVDETGKGNDYLSFEIKSQETGQAELGVKTVKLEEATTSKTGLVDAYDAKTYVDSKAADLAVEAEGDDYITAEVDATNNKKINVTADVQALEATEGTKGEYDNEGKETTAPVAATLTGTEKSLVDGADVAAKVTTFVNGAIAIEVERANAAITAAIAKLDATVKDGLDASDDTKVASGKHVGVKVVETDGKLTSISVVEDDIASAQGLADEITRAKAAETAIDSVVGLTKAAESESRTYTNTGNYIGKGETNTVASDIKALDTKLKEVADATDVIQYKVDGTTLEFFGISAKA